MAESLEQHYRRLLGLEEPWVVEAVLRLDWHSAHQIMERAVERGLKRRTMETVRLVGIDSEELWPRARLCQPHDRSGTEPGFGRCREPHS